MLNVYIYRIYKFIILLLLIFFICSNSYYIENIININDINYIKYKAKYLYNKHQYNDSYELFNYLLVNNLYKNNNLLYNIAKFNFKNKKYFIAANLYLIYYNNIKHYNNFLLKKNILFKNIYCYYLLSNNSNIEKQFIKKIILILQNLINHKTNYFYKNKKINLKILLNNLIIKLEQQEIENAIIANNNNKYLSTLFILSNFINNNLKSPFIEDAFYNIIKSYIYRIYNNNYTVNNNTIKKDFKYLIILYEKFKIKYPNSKYNNHLTKMLVKISYYITNLCH